MLRQLIAACQRNERAAQHKLYELYGPFVFNIVRRYTASPDIVREIQSEAFYRILTRLEQYRFEGSFEGWMRRVTAHVIADYFRRNARHTVPLEEDTLEYPAYAETDGLEKLAYRELLEMVHTLPVTQRTVFNLFVFEQYSHKEIAAALAITENNSRWQMNDARRRLKEKIKSVNR